MKKTLSFILAMLMLLTLVACGSTSADSNAPGATGSAMDQLPADASLSQTIIADFTDKVNSGNYTSVSELGEAMLQEEYLPFAGAGMPVEEGFLNGFTAEISGFANAYMFGPAIGAIPFVGYIFELDSSTSTSAFIDNLKDLADLRWNICTEADEMNAGTAGNMVCFVMSPISFEE